MATRQDILVPPFAQVPIGRRFGRWVVLEAAARRGKRAYWLCRCLCGVEKEVFEQSLRRGISKSCGCRKRTHGMTDTVEYQAWEGMKSRCTRPGNASAAHYQGRGITVCPEWMRSFQAFFDHVGLRPSPRHSLDRIDNDGGYCPGNVRWATMAEQGLNKRNNHLVSWEGRLVPVAEAARRANLPYSTVLARLKVGWTEARALATPRRRYHASHLSQEMTTEPVN